MSYGVVGGKLFLTIFLQVCNGLHRWVSILRRHSKKGANFRENEGNMLNELNRYANG